MKGKHKISSSDVIVGILCLTLLLLTLGAAGRQGRRRAREAVCVSNLRQWGAVFQGYLDRNDGIFFRGSPGSGYYWVEEMDKAHKDRNRMKIWLCPEADTPTRDEEGNLSGSPSVFSAWGIYKGLSYGPTGLAGSYGINGYTIHIHESGRYEGGVRGRDGWRDFDTVPHADNVPWFVDALRFDLWPRETDAPALNEFAAWSTNSMARCCINRHDGAVNCLFLDSSARKVGLKELWTLKWHRSFDTEGPWTEAGGALPSDWPEWMRNFKNY